RPETSSRPASRTAVRRAAAWSIAGRADRMARSSSVIRASSSGSVGVVAPTTRWPAPVKKETLPGSGPRHSGVDATSAPLESNSPAGSGSSEISAGSSRMTVTLQPSAVALVGDQLVAGAVVADVDRRPDLVPQPALEAPRRATLGLVEHD